MAVQGALAITAGRLFDGTGAPPLEPANVVIEERRISAVGPAASVPVPEGATVIDAAGKTVMPGLIDMHVHVVLSGEDSLYCWLGTGITTVRDLGGQPDYVLPLRDRIASGERVGPRIFSYGPALNAVPSADQLGPELSPLIAREIPDAEEGERAVEELVERGVDGVKLYAGLGPEVVERLIRAADGRVPVTGHLSRTWASETIAAGIDGLEHVYASLYEDVARPEDRHTRDGGNSLSRNPTYWLWLSNGWARADLEADYVQRFIESLVEQRVALSPTTVLITGGIRSLEEPGLKYLPAFLIPERRRGMLWRMPQGRDQAAADDRPPPESQAREPDVWQRSHAQQLAFLAMLYRAGGIIVPSTDTPFANMMPGFSLHLELAELVEAGMSNSDVLQAATRVAAETLRRGDDLGTLEVGKIADVLVLDGDPLVDINATRNVVTVIKDGVPYAPQELLDRVTVASQHSSEST